MPEARPGRETNWDRWHPLAVSPDRKAFDTLSDLQTTIHRVRPSSAWEAFQLSRGRVQGAVVTVKGPDVQVTGTRANGCYELRGILSNRNLAFGIGLDLGSPAHSANQPLRPGLVGLFRPGDTLDFMARGDLTYFTIDTSEARFAAELAHEDVEPGSVIPGAGGLLLYLDRPRIAQARTLSDALHAGRPLPPGMHPGEMLLSMIARQIADAGGAAPCPRARNHARIAARARAYIDANLENPIPIDDLADAAFASRRTLHRAFQDILGESPQQYILKLRLNRIRRDLASPGEATRTVTLVSMKWGITELGRLAAQYREQFGELPSETLNRRRHPASLAQAA